jgi:alpha-D-ribose 1-methylphosphonate 5-triphosphate synthase subunit PhnH
MDASLEGAFADPVHAAQQAFRAILDALANPGQMQDLPIPTVTNLRLSGEFVSTLLTLTDHDTPIWLADCYRSDPVRAFIGFHTGAPIVDAMDRAQFAFTDAASLPRLDQFNPGTQEYPDRSTTIVLELPALTGGPALTLRGPGIENTITISPPNLPVDFTEQWAANREIFPRGVDLLLVSGGRVFGLPRSTRIMEA